MRSIIEATGLSKRYGTHWALRDCSLAIPAGRVTALVGPNGAGKSTMLHLAVGLLDPTAGTVTMLGARARENPDVLSRLGFVAQGVPLYPTFRVRELITLGGHLNPRWDEHLAAERLERLGIPFDRQAGTLSGGERAQVALALALAKRPELLILDEPVASLDPLARREFLSVLMEEVADTGVSVVLSSHLIGDLERVCDHLVVLSASRLQVAGPIDDLLASHRVMVGPRRESSLPSGVEAVVHRSDAERQSILMARVSGRVLDPAWTVRTPDLEELVLAYMSEPGASELPAIAAVGGEESGHPERHEMEVGR